MSVKKKKATAAGLKKPTPAMQELLRKAGDMDPAVASAAQRQIAKALTLPLKQAVLNGDVISGIFEPISFEPGQSTEFPLDFIRPGMERDFIAYTIPNVGRMPDKNVEGDYVMVPTYDVGATISWNLKYARDARWDVVGRAMQTLQAMFTRKANDDGWHVLLAAGVSQNTVVYDSAATAGLFTKRAVALLKTVMRRNAGGNSTSTDRGQLTDLFISPEGLEDIRSWDLTQVDDATRREIYLATGVGGTTSIFGVTLHDLDELGVAQDYQRYFTSLGGTLPTDKTEIAVGLDLRNRDSFVHPVRQEVRAYENMLLHMQNQAGVYARAEHGFGCLDNRRVMLLAF